jgi:hypothetical protein
MNRIPLRLLILLSTVVSCTDVVAPDGSGRIRDVAVEPADAALRWAGTTLFAIRNSAGNSPTYASRSLGYMGLAMYEAIVWGDSSHVSMGGQLNGLILPKPQAGKAYEWMIVLNAAQQALLEDLYSLPGNANASVKNTIDTTASAMLRQYSAGLSNETIERSAQFGRDLAEAIYQWSLTDGGDKGYARNFEPSFTFPSGPSYWVPPTRGQSSSKLPLHPYWGENRTFVKANGSLSVPAIVPFSTDPSSAYYRLYRAVYEKDKMLTREEREIAAWWGDDPSESVSPPGHAYYLAGIVVRDSKAGLMRAAEAFAKTGLSVADAFINCWKVKYVYFNERPSSYVAKYIDPAFRQFWPEPPFPAFSSGHATQCAAAATVLSSVFGNAFAFTDDLHVGERRFDDVRFLDLTYPARSFRSFKEAADECAFSRFLGGIHTQQDNDVGLAQGAIIGQHVNELQWRK